MPLNTKDEVEEKDNPDPAEPAPVELPEVESADGTVLPLDEAARMNASFAKSAAEGVGKVDARLRQLEERVAELNDQLEQKDRQIAELQEAADQLGRIAGRGGMNFDQ
jgi:TolA-binding protein